MYRIDIEDWEIESNQYLNIDRKVKNLASGETYLISELSSDGIKLKEIPYFKNKKSEDLQIEFPELLKAFNENVFGIEGFETGQGRELKIAIASLIKKVRILEKDNLLTNKDLELSEKNSQINSINAEKEKKKNLEIDRIALRKAKATEMQTKLIEIELTIE